MKKKTKLGLGIGGAAILLVAILVTGFIWMMGEARYHPGEMAGTPGKVGPRRDFVPIGPLTEGQVRQDGSQEFSLEVEPGLRIRGFARGQGAPVIVIHGGPGFPPETTWAGLDAFATRHRFYYPHQRGSGWSDRPVDRFASADFGANLEVLGAKLGLAQQIADIERLRRALGVERIDLVGHSFGGLIACLYAIEFPGSVGRILLVAPAGMIRFPADSGGLYAEIRQWLPPDRLAAYDAWLQEFFDYGRLFQRSETELVRINAAMVPFYREAFARRAAQTGIGVEAAATADGASDNPALTGGWMMQAIFFDLGQRHDWTAAFTKIGAPVTMVYGDGDLSEQSGFEQYRVIPGIRVEAIKDADHFVADDASRFAQAGAVRDVLE